MIRTILFATDGLTSNAAAPQSAIRLAARFSAKITALGIIDAPWILRGEAVPLGGMGFKIESEGEQLRSGHERVQAALQEFQAAARASGIKTATAELEGDPLQLITAEASAHDLVVIDRAARFHIGSRQGVSPLLKALSRDTPRPVIATAGTATAGERVLIAFDGSAAASRAMHLALLLGLGTKTKIQLLTIDADPVIAKERSGRAAALLRSHQAEVDALDLRSDGDPADTILDRAKSFGADLVVIGAYGHGGLRDAIFGSCTRRLLADCAPALFLQH